MAFAINISAENPHLNQSKLDAQLVSQSDLVKPF